MIRSMTAFGNAVATLPLGTAAVEIRSVNSRYLDLHFRLPDEFRHLETALREQLTRSLQRGKVELRLAITRRQPDGAGALNPTALREMANLLHAVRQIVPDTQAPRLAEVLAWPGVQAEEANDASCDTDILDASQHALDQLQAARLSEGRRLAEIMAEHTRAMREITARVEAQMPSIVAEYQARLARKLRETVEAAFPGGFQHIGGVELSERLSHEASLFSLRIDVAEELSRLKSHLVEVERILGVSHTSGTSPNTPNAANAKLPTSKSKGSAGKRLDFLFQEMNREANTLGSKAGALDMTHAALDLKLLIEQLREQAQNIE